MEASQLSRNRVKKQGGKNSDADTTIYLSTCDLQLATNSRISPAKTSTPGGGDGGGIAPAGTAAPAGGRPVDRNCSVKDASKTRTAAAKSDDSTTGGPRGRSRALRSASSDGNMSSTRDISDKRRRRRSTIRMTAKQTREVHRSTSYDVITSRARSKSAADASRPRVTSSQDDGALPHVTATPEPMKRRVSCVNIFVVARAVHRVGTGGEMVKAEDPPCAQFVPVPHDATQIQDEVLRSGIAFSSGEYILSNSAL